MTLAEFKALGAVQRNSIPARERWLYENPEALASVNAGLKQAAAGHLSEGPDLDVAIAFADQIED